ncbi:MAG: hypothetical protein QF460_02825 [Candidatus Nanoarchaeia archaeon]|nr:hypothetical protein [Candidatus Nanoarchaeia archaeon]
MKKKGDLSMSFGMIFSIIMIIAILGVAFYAISYFLNLEKCTGVGLFHDDFQKKVDESWIAELVSGEHSLTIPGGVEYVCFGDLENEGNIDGSTREILDEIKRFASPRQLEKSNMFMYPENKACGMGYKTANHLQELEEFICFENRDGKITFRLTKESEDSFVGIS